MSEELFELRSPLAEIRASVLDRLSRRVVLSKLARLRSGAITLIDGKDRFELGRSDATLRATVFVHAPSFYRSLLLGGALGGAEAYMDGSWRSDDLPAVIRMLAADREGASGLDGSLPLLRRPALALLHAMRRNTRSGSRRNISAHYDLGNEFFELFLDPTLTYSAGIFESEDASLEQASAAKYERICRKLDIGPRDHVLEIGSGWGGFALHAARTTGCRVTTTTISRKQYDVARERIDRAGLADRVTLLFQDYRDLEGAYDKLVSIEMIEAVGHDHLDSFFRVCSDRLVANGRMAIQAITIPDRDFEAHVRSVDFIKRYIFPGGELVSVGAMNDAATRADDLRLTHLEDLTSHYAETLRRWRRQMLDNLPRMRALGLDDRFLRMWEFYLCYCEGGFDERAIGLVQAVFEKPGSRAAPVLGRLG